MTEKFGQLLHVLLQLAYSTDYQKAGQVHAALVEELKTMQEKETLPTVFTKEVNESEIN